MYEMTEHADTASLMAKADSSRKKIAAVSDILFRLSQSDPDVKICGTLTAAVRSLGTEDIPDVSGIKRYIYLARVLERIDETEERLSGFQSELKGALTELYKTDELLRTLSEQLIKESDILLSLENRIKELLSSGEEFSQNEKELLERQLRDMDMSRIVAAKNGQLIDSFAAKNSGLISGILSVETTLLPLWRSQLSEARASCTADDIGRAFETGRLTAEKLLSFSSSRK
ncbi:MAG: hypothetical protein ACI4J0_01310 [Huintestinicola sp.]|uniref:hypothetical protein n=1 Tax=Huintestinicola sp. TaxID=2981661 RepID=UPI003EFC40DC